MPENIRVHPPVLRSNLTAEGGCPSVVPSPSSDEQSLDRLARLTALQYDRARQAEATRLGIRLETLDSEVAKWSAA